MKDTKYKLSSKKKVNLRKPFRLSDNNEAVKVTAEAVISPEESALIDAKGLLSMYQQGYLDATMQQPKNRKKNPLKVWDQIKEDCRFCFNYRYMESMNANASNNSMKGGNNKDE